MVPILIKAKLPRKHRHAQQRKHVYKEQEQDDEVRDGGDGLRDGVEQAFEGVVAAGELEEAGEAEGAQGGDYAQVAVLDEGFDDGGGDDDKIKNIKSILLEFRPGQSEKFQNAFHSKQESEQEPGIVSDKFISLRITITCEN